MKVFRRQTYRCNIIPKSIYTIYTQLYGILLSITSVKVFVYNIHTAIRDSLINIILMNLYNIGRVIRDTIINIISKSVDITQPYRILL